MQEERMRKGETSVKKVVSVPITVVSKAIVEATLGEELRKKNRHGTKIINVSVFYYDAKNAENKKYGKKIGAVCRLWKDESIHWEFEKCPIEVQNTVKSMFPEEKLISYIKNLK